MSRIGIPFHTVGEELRAAQDWRGDWGRGIIEQVLRRGPAIESYDDDEAEEFANRREEDNSERKRFEWFTVSWI